MNIIHFYGLVKNFFLSLSLSWISLLAMLAAMVKVTTTSELLLGNSIS